MNKQLSQLYSLYWDSVIQNIYKSKGSAYPFLITATQHYQNASKRVMICGQETQGWGGEYKDPDVVQPDNIMNLYNGFVNHDNHGGPIQRPGYIVSKHRAYISPYWNFIWRVMRANPDVGFVMQNVVKIGKRSGAGCNEDIYQLTKEYFPVWRKELDILRPDCIIFLSGTYDDRISEVAGHFKKEKVHGVDGRLDKLIFEDKAMPIAYRTNHPRYLQSDNKYFSMATVLIDIIGNL